MTEVVMELAFMFVLAGALLLVANHFGLSTIPFYLIAGLIAGPFVDHVNLIDLALWGIAFLVFVFGIRIDFRDLQSVFRDAEVAAFTQLIVVAPIAFAVGYILIGAFGFEDPIRNAIYFAAAATLSSTIVGAGVLEREIRNNLVYGRLASSIHVFDDVVAMGAVVVLSAVTLTDAQLVTSKIGYGVLFLLAGLLCYRHGFPLLVRAAEGFDELVLMGSISILIAFIAAAELAGVSIVVGAFAAGIGIRSEGAESLGVRNGIESIKDFFAAIFFVTIGALVQFPTAAVAVLAGVMAALVLLVNPLVHTLAFLSEGYDSRTAFLASTSLNQISEFSLVIAIQALLLGTIHPELFDAIILAAAVTMILTVLGRRYEDALFEVAVSPIFGSRQARQVDEYSRIPDGLTDHVIVIGYGRQGRRLVETIENLDRSYVVIENDPVRWDDLRSQCENYVFGDAMAEYPMERARMEAATLIVSTVDHRPLSETLLEREPPGLTILRADTSEEAAALIDDGATYVAVPNVLAGDRLVDAVSHALDGERTIPIEDHLDAIGRLEQREFTPGGG